jgi:pyrroloquinoline quinone (PQQ) biosynthesis protein C
MGQAPLDVKREIWLHEQDELMGDPRAGGTDHYTLNMQEANLLGVSAADIEKAELHPFVVAALSAWIHLAKKSWLESFASVAVVEMVNSNALVTGGGFSYRIRQKLVSELGIRQELLRSKNVHVQADQEHAMIFDKVVSRHAKTDSERNLVWESAKQALVLDRAYRGGLAFAMNQIPLDTQT